ncbi:MAG: hypothetical protein IJN50_06165 [Clostridia bacterium]|nr:hypothetical protein [Clostridia bacterium]
MNFKIKEMIFIIILLICVVIFTKDIVYYVKETEQIKQEENKYEAELKDNKKYLNDIIEETKDIDKSENYAYNNPYVLEGFKHITGEYNTGFVIQDELQNEFVWVPCSLDNEKQTTILGRYDFNENSNNFIDTKVFECMEKDEKIEEFILSVQKYGGFYIARYEAGKENEILVSKKNVQAWNNITQQDAIDLSSKMYNSDEFNNSLINSFAWDTTLKWLEQTNDIKYSEIATSNNNTNTYITGDTLINNIYDFNGNVSEWTTEVLEKFAVFRAGGFYDEELNETSAFVGNRNIISKKAKYDSIGFRVILYKKN